VAVQISSELLESNLKQGNKSEYRSSVSLPARGEVTPPPGDIAEAVEVYLSSDATEPPLIIVGRGAVHEAAESEIREFAEITNGVIVNTLRAKDYLTDHPYSVGLIGEWGKPLANELASRAGAVFAVGCSLNHHTIDDGRLFREDAKIIHIDPDPAALDRFLPVDSALHGDATSTLRELRKEFEDQDLIRTDAFWTDSLQADIARSSVRDGWEFTDRSERIDPREVVATLDSVLPTERIVITDGGHFTRFVVDGLSTTHPDNFVWTIDFGSIGLGIPVGLGASRARPDTSCVSVCGDSGAMMSIQELETAARHQIPLTVVIMNDSALRTEHIGLEKAGMNSEVALMETPSLAEVAEAFGAIGYTIRSGEELRDLEAELVDPPDGPVLLDCKIDDNVLHRTKR